VLLASSQSLAAKKVWVYILACAGNRIYVGFTRRLHARLQDHFAGVGAIFTRRFRPLRVLELIPATSEHDEFRIWNLHAHRLGKLRVGGYCQALAEEFNFTWEYPVALTRRAFVSTSSLTSDFKCSYTTGKRQPDRCAYAGGSCKERVAISAVREAAHIDHGRTGTLIRKPNTAGGERSEAVEDGGRVRVGKRFPAKMCLKRIKLVLTF
jgi:hypothetical protein